MLIIMNINNALYQKQRSSHTLLFILLGGLLFLLLLPIAAVYILFYDSDTIDVEYEQGYNLSSYTKEVTDHLAVNALDSASTNGKVMFSLRKNQINTLLHYGLEEKLSDDAKDFIKKAYLDISNNKYYFYVDTGTPFWPHFKTRVCLITEFKDMESELGVCMKIIDAQVGRLDGIFNIAESFATPSQIQNALQRANLPFKVDWNKKEIYLPFKDFLSKFGFTTSGNSGNFLYDIVAEMINANDSPVVTDYSDGFSIGLDVSSAHDETKSAGVYTHFHNTIAQINEEFKDSISIDNEQLTNRFTEVAKDLGEKPNAGGNIQSYLIANSDIATHSTYISENEFNTFLRGTDLFGRVYPFTAKNQDGTNTIKFVTINDFYCDIKENNNVDFTINIDINGYDTQMELSATIADKIQNNSDNKLVLDININSVKYGHVVSLWDEKNHKPRGIAESFIKDGFEMDEIKISGDKISVEVNNPMYNIGNEITTNENELKVQVFVPQLYYGPVHPDDPSAPERTYKEGDMYLVTTTRILYTYLNTNSWDAGVDILNPAWQAANADLWSQIQELLA